MFFDDRLATVLRQEATSPIGKRTQYRQLLDILGNRKFGPDGRSDPSLIAAAWLRMESLAQDIPDRERAAMIREPSWRFRSADLASHLADFEPEVASAALNRAQLSADDWTALIPRLPVRARGFLRQRRDLPQEADMLLERLGVHDRGLPRPSDEVTLIAAEEALVETALSEADDTGTDTASLDDLAALAIPGGRRLVEPEPKAEPEPKPEPAIEAEAEALDSDAGLTNAGSRSAFVQFQEPVDDSVGNAEADTVEPIEPPLADGPGDTAEDSEAEASDTDSADTASIPDEGDQAAAEAVEAPSETPVYARARPADPVESGRSEISALVERIATFKRTRDLPVTDSDRSPRLPLGEVTQPRDRRVAQFAFATDAGGRIEWAETEVAPMVVGARIVAAPVLGGSAMRGVIERAFTQRQPIMQAEAGLEGAPAIAGEWIVDAQPRFSDEGNFTGYVGRFRRPAQNDDDLPDQATREADRIRQLLHELRTPVTAVQGYAEVIQQQLFGPAPHEYRALAAEIAADGARILSGFEQLDRLARLEGGLGELDQGEADLAHHARRTVKQLSQVLGPRSAGITIEKAPEALMQIAVDADDTDMILWRVLATLGGGCDAGEQLTAALESDESHAWLSCDLPRQLVDEEDIFTADAQPVGGGVNAGLFGAGFALRLARAEARASQGDITREGDRIVLTLPLVGALDANYIDADDALKRGTRAASGLTDTGEAHSHP
ncbi:MAG: histidine kinase dimerization/phospho-acceptor domain-containing protein [Pseudomonadota bacterium]